MPLAFELMNVCWTSNVSKAIYKMHEQRVDTMDDVEKKITFIKYLISLMGLFIKWMKIRIKSTLKNYFRFFLH